MDLAVITTKEQLLQRRDEMCCPQGGQPSEHVVRPSGSRAPGQGQRKPPKAAAAGKSGYEKKWKGFAPCGRVQEEALGDASRGRFSFLAQGLSPGDLELWLVPEFPQG